MSKEDGQKWLVGWITTRRGQCAGYQLASERVNGGCEQGINCRIGDLIGHEDKTNITH